MFVNDKDLFMTHHVTPLAYFHIPGNERRNLEKKAEKMHFVCYSLTSKGYEERRSGRSLYGKMSNLTRMTLITRKQ